MRSILFWTHLVCGVFAGAIILIMCVTGVLLTYQRQITAWADMRGYDARPPSPRAPRLPADELIARAKAVRPDLVPASLVLRSGAGLPATIAVGAGRQIFVNPYTGAVLGEGTGGAVRAFFRRVIEWHRYLAMSGENRAAGKAMTGAANLTFLFIVISGLFLWWPRTWTASVLRNITWFRSGLSPKARDFNWHNTIGFWSAIPLAVVVAGAVVISYPWATALVYRAYGEQPPAPAGASRAGAPAAGAAGVHSRHASEGAPIQPLVQRAMAQVEGWQTITVPLAPGPRAAVVIDTGDGGQPHKRATLTLNRRTAAVERWEPYASQSAGRRVRTWLRFAHTGEVYGIPGQTVAGLVTAGGAVLVWTGIALALRRFTAWRRQRRPALPKAA